MLCMGSERRRWHLQIVCFLLKTIVFHYFYHSTYWILISDWCWCSLRHGSMDGTMFVVRVKHKKPCVYILGSLFQILALSFSSTFSRLDLCFMDFPKPDCSGVLRRHVQRNIKMALQTGLTKLPVTYKHTDNTDACAWKCDDIHDKTSTNPHAGHF